MSTEGGKGRGLETGFAPSPGRLGDSRKRIRGDGAESRLPHIVRHFG